MDYESLIEKNVNHMLDKMFGDKDPTLKTITKMNLMFDGDEETLTEMELFLSKMRKINFLETKSINEELQLTYDNDGNIVSIYDIKEDETKDNICKEPKNEPDTDFCTSNR